MSVSVLLGLQWGDEGKGKVVDYLAPGFDIIARFQGGPNAGHTLEFNGIKHVLHQIPSGIFHDHIINVIGNGVVLDPIVFEREIEGLKKFNIDFSKLLISKKAQLILPTHKKLDAAYERSKGDKKIGSTLKGIGPCYQDKIARLGLRVGDILLDDFKERYKKLVNNHCVILNHYGEDCDIDQMEREFFDAVESMRSFQIIDSEFYLNEKIAEGKSILAEGAQGALLDIDFGSYPYVTSSSTMVAGASSGLGIAPSKIKKVFGITKAYCTRVGSGPFPTELNDEVGEKLRKAGNEFGSTTGRPRRTGWIDIPALKYAIMLNGVTELYIMKADILDTFEEIKVCTAYKLKDGSTTDKFRFDLDHYMEEPVYETIKGWNCNTGSISKHDALPTEAKDYISFLERVLQVPVRMLSVGADREATIFI